MSFHGIRRERVTPWKRAPKAHRPDVERESMNNKPKRRRFYLYPQNRHLDAYTNRAALTVSRSVVSLESYSGEEMIFQCSGTIVDSVDTCNIILTTASLLRCSTNRNSVVDNIKVIVHLFDGRSFDGHIESYDFHYNIAAIKIQLDTLLPVASLAYLNDSIVIDPSQLQGSEKKSFQLRPHSNSFDLFPGVSIIALGRLNRKPYDIMAAPGEFSQSRPPWLGMEVTNLYAANLELLERIIPKLPDVLKGVIVEEVVPGSSAESAGVKHNDVIVHFGGTRIHSFLELFENMWNNVGESMELAVIRASHDVPVHLRMVEEVTSDKLYRWPLWKE
ncbi:uncharacterized protein LOC107010121 isoform X1 [Solanum pennellii]|uniref:Uncharacterized protein LOC107010121 isoform X1 n=1 Tax=Solanum pennellii TaxID=28526 RepID=A0ABM1V3C7_SOLPN|nr:uncharacterized protein LOC107010121 isoform X1 [Solanum pennellii]